MSVAKITLTLEQDDEMGTNAAMEETIALLGALDALPTMKLVLTLECEDIIAERYREKLRLGLKSRPIGIIAKIQTKTEESVAREVMRPTTPMDAILSFADRHGARVEFTTAPATGDETLFDEDEA
jgi:hypothetical protein